MKVNFKDKTPESFFTENDANELKNAINHNESVISNTNVSGYLDEENRFRYNMHLVPKEDGVYNIGSPDHKIKELFISDGSIWIGDDTKIDIQDDKLSVKTRDKTKLPHYISNNLQGTINGALAFAGVDDISQISLAQIYNYAKSLDPYVTFDQIFPGNQEGSYWSGDYIQSQSLNQDSSSFNEIESTYQSNIYNLNTIDTNKFSINLDAVDDPNLILNIQTISASDLVLEFSVFVKKIDSLSELLNVNFQINGEYSNIQVRENSFNQKSLSSQQASGEVKLQILLKVDSSTLVNHFYCDYYYFSDTDYFETFVASITSGSIDVGDTTIDVEDQSLFQVGDIIVIDEGGANEEENEVIGFGSLKLKDPITNAHPIGTAVKVVKTTPSVTTTPTATPSVTTTATVTPTASNTPGASPSTTPTVTPSITATPSVTVTPTSSTIEPSPTPTVTSSVQPDASIVNISTVSSLGEYQNIVNIHPDSPFNAGSIDLKLITWNTQDIITSVIGDANLVPAGLFIETIFAGNEWSKRYDCAIDLSIDAFVWPLEPGMAGGFRIALVDSSDQTIQGSRSTPWFEVSWGTDGATVETDNTNDHSLKSWASTLCFTLSTVDGVVMDAQANLWRFNASSPMYAWDNNAEGLSYILDYDSSACRWKIGSREIGTFGVLSTKYTGPSNLTSPEGSWDNGHELSFVTCPS